MFGSTARFLIVDDSEVSRQTVRSALEQLSYRNLEEAVDGKAGWQKINESMAGGQLYSAIFLDLNMPKMDGFEVLEKCRRDPKLSNLPIIMITSESQKPAVIRAVMQGVSGYVVKPFGVEDIKKKLFEVSEKLKQQVL